MVKGHVITYTLACIAYCGYTTFAKLPVGSWVACKDYLILFGIRTTFFHVRLEGGGGQFVQEAQAAGSSDLF